MTSSQDIQGLLDKQMEGGRLAVSLGLLEAWKRRIMVGGDVDCRLSDEGND